MDFEAKSRGKWLTGIPLLSPLCLMKTSAISRFYIIASVITIIMIVVIIRILFVLWITVRSSV